MLSFNARPPAPKGIEDSGAKQVAQGLANWPHRPPDQKIGKTTTFASKDARLARARLRPSPDAGTSDGALPNRRTSRDKPQRPRKINFTGDIK
jgi:hypothetical protein